MEVAKLARLLAEANLVNYVDKLEHDLSQVAIKGSSLQKSLEQALKPGGKRLRPILTIYIASVHTKVNQRVINAAVAVELVHLASLVHDDLIDKSASRRQSSSIFDAQGPNLALLSGDYLLSAAMTKALGASEAVAQQIAESIAQMAEGESLSLADQTLADPRSSTYLKSIQQKTATLFRVACVSGGLLAGLSDSSLANLAKFGEDFGIAYQIIDDILDGDINKDFHEIANQELARRSLSAARAIDVYSDKLAELPNYYLNWALAQ